MKSLNKLFIINKIFIIFFPSSILCCGMTHTRDVSQVNIETRNTAGFTPLLSAAQVGDTELVKRLLELKANAKAKTNEGKTALILAVENDGTVETIEALLESDIDINAFDTDGATALHYACHTGKVDIVKALIKNNVSRGETPLRTNAEILSSKVRREGLTPLMVICARKKTQEAHHEICSLLIDSDKGSTNYRSDSGFTPLFVAALNENFPLCSFLVKKKPNLVNDLQLCNGRYLSSLSVLAVMGVSEDIFSLFAQNHSDPNQAENVLGLTALHALAAIGNCALAQKLLVRESSLTVARFVTKDRRSQTQGLGFEEDFTDAESLQIQEDVIPTDINKQDIEGRTALHWAVEKEHAKMVELLLRYGASTALGDKDNKTVLRYAREANSTDIIILLQANHATLTVARPRKHSKFKITPERTKKFSDIGGNIPEDIQGFIDGINERERYRNMGVAVEKCLLIAGDSGVGKTLWACGIAGETNAAFFMITPCDLYEGPKDVKDLFEAAREAVSSGHYTKSIIFMDEIHGIADNSPENDNSERRNTFNQLLTELSSLQNDDSIFFLAATHSPSKLDPAIMRPGRIGKTVVIKLPDRNERKDILQKFIRPLRTDNSIEVETLVAGTDGWTAAKLKELVDGAGRRAARQNQERITMYNFRELLPNLSLT